MPWGSPAHSINLGQLYCSTFPVSSLYPLFICKFGKKLQRRVLASLCLSVRKCHSDSHWPAFRKIQFLSQSGNSQIFTEHIFHCHVRYTRHFCMVCQISPFHKLLSNCFMFQPSLILTSLPSSSKQSLSSVLQLLKPLCIYALHHVFQTPRPFSSPIFHQPNIVCSAAHITKLPVL